MSIYIPKSATVKQHTDGTFWVYDQHGPYDGPYSERDAWSIAHSICDEEKGRAAKRVSA